MYGGWPSPTSRLPIFTVLVCVPHALSHQKFDALKIFTRVDVVGLVFGRDVGGPPVGDERARRTEVARLTHVDGAALDVERRTVLTPARRARYDRLEDPVLNRPDVLARLAHRNERHFPARGQRPHGPIDRRGRSERRRGLEHDDVVEGRDACGLEHVERVQQRDLRGRRVGRERLGTIDHADTARLRHRLDLAIVGRDDREIERRRGDGLIDRVLDERPAGERRDVLARHTLRSASGRNHGQDALVVDHG
jgi:hypothetical protein